jgi:hypothetical protein
MLLHYSYLSAVHCQCLLRSSCLTTVRRQCLLHYCYLSAVRRQRLLHSSCLSASFLVLRRCSALSMVSVCSVLRTSVMLSAVRHWRLLHCAYLSAVRLWCLLCCLCHSAIRRQCYSIILTSVLPGIGIYSILRACLLRSSYFGDSQRRPALVSIPFFVLQ